MRWLVSLIAVGSWMLAGLTACSGKDASSLDETSEDLDPEGDADTDADADSDADADTDTDSDDTSPEQPVGLLLRLGQATADISSYTGIEEWTFTGDSGYGDLLCHIRYDLVQTEVRTDCSACLWAFDLAVANAEVLVDEEGACQTALGVDATTVSSWNGIVRSYGYNPDFFGHAQVLMVYEKGVWDGATYASYDEATGALLYEWIDGEVEY